MTEPLLEDVGPADISAFLQRFAWKKNSSIIRRTSSLQHKPRIHRHNNREIVQQNRMFLYLCLLIIYICMFSRRFENLLIFFFSQQAFYLSISILLQFTLPTLSVLSGLEKKIRALAATQRRKRKGDLNSTAEYGELLKVLPMSPREQPPSPRKGLSSHIYIFK